MTTHTDVQHAPVELRMRASLTQLPVLRAAAGSVAMLADFDVDQIADIRLVADEICSMVMSVAEPETSFHCTFQVRDGRFEVHAVGTPVVTAAPLTSTFGWQIVTALTEKLRCWTSVDAVAHVERLHVEACSAGQT